MFQRFHAWLVQGGRLVFNTPQEPYTPTTPLLFDVVQEAGVNVVRTGLLIGSPAKMEQMLGAAGFSNVQVLVDADPPNRRKVDPAQYGADQWNGFLNLPCAPGLCDLSLDVQARLQARFVTRASTLINTLMEDDPEGLYADQLTTLWVAAQKQ
ncbi:hypothetical protein WJX72_004837 [[Myrmecia] bisecta]|uniref:Uncharacterized protein n=1 Tax=[Myrmecia] bisecta TaxID=41462 RepID=A0AAW1QAG2_9CHLO